MKHYLVTGASGFIGSALSRHLESSGHSVVALNKKQSISSSCISKTFACNLGFEPLPAGLLDDVEGVFHLANIAHTSIPKDQISAYKSVNVDGTVALLNACREAGVNRFVYLSSVRAMGPARMGVADESVSPCPDDDYGLSKLKAEQEVIRFGEETGTHVCNLRPALVFGRGVKGNLARMLGEVRRHRYPPLPDFNDKRSMVWIQDLVAAAHTAMVDPRANGQTYIVADDVEYSSRSIYEAMCQAMDIPIPQWELPIPVLRAAATAGDMLQRFTPGNMPFNSQVLSTLSESSLFSSEKIQRELGWKPEKTFYDVLPDMINELG